MADIYAALEAVQRDSLLGSPSQSSVAEESLQVPYPGLLRPSPAAHSRELARHAIALRALSMPPQPRPAQPRSCAPPRPAPPRPVPPRRSRRPCPGLVAWMARRAGVRAG